MKLNRVFALASKSITLAILVTGTAFALPGEQYSSEAKLSLTQARQIAGKTYPGKFVSEELEKESGGSGLRYSFVILKKNVKHEVGVDAKTGAILENSIEGENSD